MKQSGFNLIELLVVVAIISITDVTFISADKHLMDDQSLINVNAAVDTLTNQLLTQIK
jgi:prepilin-type N-terminal cleavage/methylation domain-containing protein